LSTHDIAIRLEKVSKYYKLYRQPIDRLKEALNPFGKTYHHRYFALKHVSLNIFKGEVLGIVGPNGAGKSTLLKIVAGVLTPSEGKVERSGKINAILELGAGLKPEMTGRENIRLHLEINQIADNLKEHMLEEIVNFAEIGEFIDQPVKTYSSGMKSRLGFSIATSMEPDILIVDEALSVGDVSFKLKSYSRMKELMKNGCTVLYVSHDIQSVINLCDSAILIMDGRLLKRGSPREIAEEYQRLLFSEKNHSEKTENGLCISSEVIHRKKKEGFYSPELEKPPRVLQNRRVSIETVEIVDETGEVVNILKKGSHYKVTMDVLFEEPFSNAMFGIQFKTVNGIYIYGLRDESFYDTPLYRGDRLRITYEFQNDLLPGTYYLNLGVASTVEGKILYLTELAEASPFKVIDFTRPAGRSEYGIVSLHAKPSIQYIQKRDES